MVVASWSLGAPGCGSLSAGHDRRESEQAGGWRRWVLQGSRLCRQCAQGVAASSGGKRALSASSPALLSTAFVAAV